MNADNWLATDGHRFTRITSLILSAFISLICGLAPETAGYRRILSSVASSISVVGRKLSEFM